MGVELELGLLLILQLVGTSIFGHFEGETPAWKKLSKWLFIDSVTVGLFFVVGHYALIFPLLILILGLFFHFYFCRKHGIDPIKATPRKKYYELRGWKWPYQD